MSSCTAGLDKQAELAACNILAKTPNAAKRCQALPLRAGNAVGQPFLMASATSAKWRAGTFPNGRETEADWVAAQKRGITWRQLSDPERQAVALDAVRQKVEGGDNWQREADADVEALTTQLDAAVRQEEFRKAEVIKGRLEAINNGGANWFDARSGQWRVRDGFHDINAPIWRDRTC